MEKIISKFSISKSTGVNSIPTRILKDNADIFSQILSNLINLSFNEGVFPELLQVAKTIPIYKKGDTLGCSNYHPISLLSNLSKIYEKCMHTRIYGYLEKYNLLYNKQFGFRLKHSTNHALVSLIECLKSGLDDKMSACAVFIDLQKAFGTVDHSILLQKLYYYGIRGCQLNWFESYLTSRKQFVSVNGVNSSLYDVKCGVLQ